LFRPALPANLIAVGPTTKPPSASFRAGLAVCLLLAVHATFALICIHQRSATVDEIYHLTGGYCFNALGDYRIHADNGVFPQRLHALPAVLAGARPPPMEDNAAWRAGDVSVVCYQFFYKSGNDHWPLLRAARAVNALFGLALCLLVFIWARRLAGELAGWVALTLAALSPTLLAHAPLATTDVAAAFFLTASAGAFWAQLSAGRWWATAGSGVVFGLACVTKFSAALLIPIFLALAILHTALAPAGTRRPGAILLGLGIHALIAWVVIWACFGFRYEALAPGLPPVDNFAATWHGLLERAGWQGTVLRQIRDLRLLPEAFIYGYTGTYLGSLDRAAYLAGEYSVTGWRTFFPLAFLWKSTPAELAGLSLGAVLVALRLRQSRPWLRRFAPLLALVLVYGFVAIRSQLNIGHRHLLPLYPALFIASGVAVARVVDQRRRLAATVAILGLQVAALATIFPHCLAYFNPLAGGPANAWRLLVDSSLDWGQDLRELQTWLQRHNPAPHAAPVFLSYFGSAEPDYYGLRVRRLPFVNGFKHHPPFAPLEAGIYCVSATTLVQVYSPVRGPWTLAFEEEYQQLRRLEPALLDYATDPLRRAELERDASAAQWRHAKARYELLRFARLCHYLRVRPPDAHVGHSILIFRLRPDEVAGATAGSLADWRATLERAAQARP
jgi:4-amino-4-deoxy-L-arabinose transferase-like glycosyltransferase